MISTAAIRLTTSHWIALGLFLVAAVWALVASSRQKRAISKVFRHARSSGDGNGALSFEVDRLLSDADFTMVRESVATIRYSGHDFILVIGSVSDVVLGRFSALLAKSSQLCLIARTVEASEALANHPRIFRKVAGSESVAIYMVRDATRLAANVESGRPVRCDD